jgi:antibiotic biosynthesis monooxygenase (ABM) superfamily enzyme
VHTRALVTWVAIFPLVAIGIVVLPVLAPQWHPLFQAFVLTIAVVPLAVYFVVPWLLLVERRLNKAVRVLRAGRSSGRQTTD